MQDLIIDKEFRDLLIPLTEDEREKLQVSLMADGCLDPLKVWDGIIVDGHHRYEICQEYGIEYRVQEMEFKDRDGALVWALENQLARRNLNNFQRAETALKIEAVIAAKAKEKQKRKPQSVVQKSVEQKSVEPPIKTQNEVAKSAAVSHDTVHKVKTILEKATPEVKERARTGEISVNRAYIETRAPEQERPPKREKPLQFEDVIKRTAQCMDKVVDALTSLLEHRELFSDPQYAATFERWELNLVAEQIMDLFDKLGIKEVDYGTEKPSQNQLEE